MAMIIYDLMTAGALAATATNGVTNTETNVWAIKSGKYNVGFQSASVQGRAGTLTSLNGIGFVIASLLTAGTAGTIITPNPSDSRMPAAACTVSTAATIGTGTRLNHLAFGCGAAGPGGIVSVNPDSPITLIAGGAALLDLEMESIATGLSLTFSWSSQIFE